MWWVSLDTERAVSHCICHCRVRFVSMQILAPVTDVQKCESAPWDVLVLWVFVVVVVQKAQAQRHLMDGQRRQVLQLWEDLVGTAHAQTTHLGSGPQQL